MGVVIIFIIISLISTSSTITFSKCELVNQLRRQGFPEYLMNDLVCLIGESSGFRTHVISGPYQDGSYDFGLFQINDRHWCSTGSYTGKGCDVRCVDLVLDDITKAAACAKIILNQRGLVAWSAWEKFCEGYNFPTQYCIESLADYYKFNEK